MDTPFLPPEVEPLPPPPVSAHRRVVAAYGRIAAAGRHELWSTLRPAEDILVEAKAIDERVRAGEPLPLAGTLVAVADDIDVVGLSSARPSGDDPAPEVNATAIERLLDAGAVVLGKTKTGAKLAEWACSATASAVALELVDVSVGTDASGTARAAAACNGVVAIEPTRGLVPMAGTCAVRASDRVVVFARTLVAAERVLTAMTGATESEPFGRSWPDHVRLSAGERPTIAIPGRAGLRPLTTEQDRVFSRVVADLLATGAMVEPIDLTPFLDAGRPPHERQVRAAEALKGKDALLLPTSPGHPGPDEPGPGSIGGGVGTFTKIPGPLDMAAVAVPAGRADGESFGVSVITRTFEDQIALDLAALLTGEQLKDPYPTGGSDLVVFGPYLRGQPLNHRLTELGARFRGEATTAERYRMVVLTTEPPAAGIVPAKRGAALAGERWTLSPAALGRFLAGLPAPLTLGGMELADGCSVIGLQCAAPVAQRLEDITEFGCWRAYLRYRSATRR